jgi:RNA polymerase sigma-70 factor (ECF subfamily)
MRSEASMPTVTPAAAQPTDAQLVARAGDGDPLACEPIMRRHNRLLVLTERSIASDEAQAQDAVQEAYLHAFSRLASFRGEAALGTWLARITINVALDAQRRNGRLVSMDDRPETLVDAARESAMASFSAATDEPDAIVARGQMRELLQSVIERLPPIYRSVFMLRAVQEMSVDETAFCLHVSEAVVKTRYLRARAMLRDMLGAQLEACAADAFPFAGERCESVVRFVMDELQRQQRLHPR